jgi:ankyrin repeat protein/predicted DNA-binding WGR domain protein
MKTQKRKKSVSKLYKRNDFVVVKDLTAKHNFTLCLLKEDMEEKDKKANVVYLTRDKDKTLRNFYGQKDQKIDVEVMLFKAKNVLVTEPYDPKKSKGKAAQSIEISTTPQNYQVWRSKVKEMIKEEEGEESASGEDEIYEESVDKESVSVSAPEGRVKVPKTDLASKIARYDPLKRSTKRKASVSSVGEVSGSDAERDPSEKKVRGRKKVKGGSAKPNARSVKKVVEAPTYKKGSYNTNVVMVAKSVQYESDSPDVNFECCINCNNKELLRAAKTNNMHLLQNVINQSKELSTASAPQGPRSSVFPIVEALKNNNLDMVMQILQLENEPKAFSSKTAKIQFQLIKTGENDKYAYGVKTREVDMARANREGTNAFMYDNSHAYKSTSNAGIISQMCMYINNEDLYLKLVSLFPDVENMLSYNFYKIVELGNLELAKYVSKKFVDTNGFGFNQYHYLALVANTVEDLAGMSKINCRKKSNQNRQVTPTHLACLNPNGDILRKYLEVGEELFIVDEFLRKPIHYAAMSSTTEALSVLLEKGVDCRDYDKNKWTPMMYAAQANKPDNIVLMCGHINYNLGTKNKEGNAALHVAVENRNVDAVDALIRMGADKNQTGRNKKTPLIMAAELDCWEIVQKLLEGGAKITPSDKYGKNCLLHAVTSGNVRTVTYLLSKGADFKKTDSSGNTSLHYACAYGHWELIGHLIKAGVEINAVNSWNLSAILVALMKNHTRCLKMLVNYPEINVNCQDKDGSSLIDNCLSQFNSMSFDFCEFLIKDKHANVNILDFSGNSVLHKLAMVKLRKNQNLSTYQEAKEEYAAQKQLYLSFFKLFCESGIDKNLKNLKEYTPFEIAVNESNWAFVELALHENGFNITTLNQKGQSILFNLSNVFFDKNSDFLIRSILMQFPNLPALSNQFDNRGLNFYHSVVIDFLKKVKENTTDVWRVQKEGYYNNYVRKANELKDEETVMKLGTKLAKLNEKKLLKDNQCVNAFMAFNQFLEGNQYDFFMKVATILTPFENWVKPEESISKQNSRKAPRKAYLYNNSYMNLNYQPSYKLEATEEDKNEDKPIKLVVNKKAGETIFHLLMVYPIRPLIEQLIIFANNRKAYKPNELDFFGNSILYKYARHKSNILGIPKLLNSIGESSLIPNNKDVCPFYTVCKNENMDVIQEFIDIKSDINIVDSTKTTPFLYFAKKRSLPFCRLLLKHGANVNIQDMNGRNALHWAINNNVQTDTNFDFEEFLISERVNLTKLDIRGRSPIHYFFVSIGNPFINQKRDPIESFADFLSNKNIDIDKADSFGNTPLCYAAQRGAYLCFGALVKRGANINQVNYFGNNPLTIALLNNHVDVAVYCIQKNCLLTAEVFEARTDALLRFNSLKEDYERAFNEEEKYNTFENERIVKETKVEKFINKRKENKKLIQKFEEKAGIIPEYEVLIKKDLESLKITEFRVLEVSKFKIRTLSIFKLAIEKRADTINYLLLDNNISLGLSVFDSLESRLINYGLKLLKKRVDENNPKFLEQFRYKNANADTIAHCFALNVDAFSEELALETIDLLVQKKIDIDSKNKQGLTPLLCMVAKTNNMKIINALIAKKVNLWTVDESNNWLLSIFIQTNAAIRKVIEEKVEPAISKKRTGRAGAVAFNRPAPYFGAKTITNPTLTLPIPFNLPNIAEMNTSFNQGGGLNTSFGSGDPFGSEPKSLTGQPYNSFGSNQLQSSFYKQSSLSGRHSGFQPSTPGFTSFAQTQGTITLPLDDESIAMNFIETYLKSSKVLINQKFKNFSLQGKTKSKKTFTLLSYSLKKLANFKVARIIIQNGGDINLQNEKGYTIITWAIRKNNFKVIEFLMEFKELINFDLVDKENKTYIHHIVSPMSGASYENLDFLKWFVRDSNVNKLDNYKKPPIYYAMLQDSGRVYTALKSYGTKDYKDGKVEKPKLNLSKLNYIVNEYDFEEDHKKAVERATSLYKNTNIEIVEKPKPNKLIAGTVELMCDNKGVFYDIKLIKVEIRHGFFSENVFYMMQICKDKLRGIHVLFTNWGRVGTEGQYQQTPFFALDDCVKEFKKIFKEKTGNEYGKEDFVKIHNKYRLIRTSQRVQNRYIVNLFDPRFDQTVRPTITNDLFDLMEKITNQKLRQAVYSNLRINEELMPFGNLSKECIAEAKGVLNEILVLATKLETNRRSMSPKDSFAMANEIAEKTSVFLELIPTIGNRVGQIPSFNLSTAKNQLLKLNDIENLEIISRILGAASYRINQMHPYDYCLKSLNIKIYRLGFDSSEYQWIKQYANATKEDGRDARIKNVFAIERKGEEEEFNKWTDRKKVKLLWHGTRTENVMGILFQGLKIAPVDASRTGSRLGDGIYFTDSFKYASQFCSDFSSFSSNQSSFVFLGEIVLGKMQKVYGANEIKPITKELMSIKGIGKMTPNKNQRIYLSNGTVVPAGKPIMKYEKPPNSESHWFQFEQNEYVILNKGQVKLRYLVEFDNQGDSEMDPDLGTGGDGYEESNSEFMMTEEY